MKVLFSVMFAVRVYIVHACLVNLLYVHFCAIVLLLSVLLHRRRMKIMCRCCWMLRRRVLIIRRHFRLVSGELPGKAVQTRVAVTMQ